jgi:hypothetical protein
VVLFPEDEHEVSRTAADKKKGINFRFITIFLLLLNLPRHFDLTEQV